MSDPVPPRTAHTGQPAKYQTQREGLLLLAGIVAADVAVEIVNTLDSNGLDSDGIWARSVGHLWGIFTAPFLHVELPAPDRQHDPARVHGRDHRPARGQAARAGDADRDRRRRAWGHGWSRRRTRSPSARAGWCSDTPPTCWSRGLFDRSAARGAGRDRRRGGVGWRADLEHRAPLRDLLAGPRVWRDRRRRRGLRAPARSSAPEQRERRATSTAAGALPG